MHTALTLREARASTGGAPSCSSSTFFVVRRLNEWSYLNSRVNMTHVRSILVPGKPYTRLGWLGEEKSEVKASTAETSFLATEASQSQATSLASVVPSH